MHILYEIERLSTSGGIERILTDKANYMADVWGWDVTIVVLLEDSGKSFYRLSPKVRVKYLHVRTSGIPMCLQALWRLNRLVRSLKPDHYVTVQTIGALSCLLRTHKTHTIYEAHGIRTCMQHQLAMTIAERYADCVVVLTNGNAKRYSMAKKVVVIPNFTNVAPSPVSNPGQYGIRHCIAVGRLDFEKNFSRLISLWAKAHNQHPEWVLDIFGDGPEHAALQHQIDTLGLHNSINLKGRTADVAKAFSSSSINLMTSRFEGFGLVLIEAARCGVASVSFNCPDGPADIIEDNTTGYLIPYDDDQQFVDKLSTLMSDEHLRQEMGQCAKEMSRRYHPTQIMEMWKNLFSHVEK